MDNLALGDDELVALSARSRPAASTFDRVARMGHFLVPYRRASMRD